MFKHVWSSCLTLALGLVFLAGSSVSAKPSDLATLKRILDSRQDCEVKLTQVRAWLTEASKSESSIAPFRITSPEAGTKVCWKAEVTGVGLRA